MYSSNRFPSERGRIVAFEPRKTSQEQQDDNVLLVPPPDEPDENRANPLFRFFDVDIWLDDIIIFAVIILLIAESSFDSIVLPVLVFLFLSGFGLKF